MKNALIQLPYFGQNTLFINNPHETTGEYVFLKLYKKYYNIIQLMTLYLIFHKFISIFLAQGGAKGPRHPVFSRNDIILHCTTLYSHRTVAALLYYTALRCTTLYCYCTAL